MSEQAAHGWWEEVCIPTYGIGEPDHNPMFLQKRVYQGSSGRVYPLRVIDRIQDEKRDRTYRAVFLENEYLKIMILPELGGRVQQAIDKTNGYHFVYGNSVIKPALVGLTGPWISGGIEFNWPQHHRPSTFMPVDCEIVERSDGSVVVWCSEIDRMYGTKGRHGLTLRPSRACLEVEVHLDNRTDLPQTLLWWANPAVHVDDEHQSIFPPDVYAVMDHGKRDVSSFPIATGTYYKVDYSPGTDISRYKNIPVPTSYMAFHSDYDFVGSYDHGRGAGLLHVCDHQVSPGKKQWTWGNGDFGLAWDRHLTDDDGPYIELMCGVFTDNQPDFSWLMPGERKAFTQFFMPYKGVGVVSNATAEAAVGLEVAKESVTVRAYTTSVYRGARALLTQNGRTILDQTFDGDPRSCYEGSIAASVTIPEELRVVIAAADGRELVSYQPRAVDRSQLPEPATAIDPPEKLDSTESLYLAGLHLEQFRHATLDPADYYRDALRRDHGDARCNNALGVLLMRRGRFDEAEQRLRRSTERITRHSRNAYDGEPYYNLGRVLEYQRRFDEAVDAYSRATWNAAMQEAAYFALARIARRRGSFAEALELVDRCLARSARHLRALHLKVCLLGALCRDEDQEKSIGLALEDDPFNAGVLFEQAKRSGDWTTFERRLRDEAHNYLELAIDCCAMGDTAGAIDVLERLVSRSRAESSRAHYYLADLYRQTGQHEKAAAASQVAISAPDDTFANRLETIAVLEAAMEANPEDSRAPFELGNLFYDKRQYDRALELWERSRQIDATFPTVHRNLGLAYFNQRSDADAAWEALVTAFDQDPTDARVLFELDQLAKRIGHAPRRRLERLKACQPLIMARDDLYLEFATLLNLTGQHQRALDALLARSFHPWEGGEGKVPAQYVLALTLLARGAIVDDDAACAVELLCRAIDWPHSLGEGKLAGIQENNIHFLLGLAHQRLGGAAAARDALGRAAVGLGQPTSATYYNDQPPDMIFYQGLAQQQLGREDQATLRFRRLLDYGGEHLHDQVSIDFFAVSLPDFLVFDEDLQVRNETHCRYMMALGRLGLGDRVAADEQFERIEQLDPAHLGAMTHRDFPTILREPCQ